VRAAQYQARNILQASDSSDSSWLMSEIDSTGNERSYCRFWEVLCLTLPLYTLKQDLFFKALN